MKKILFLGLIVLASASCDDYLDINTNPNSPSSDNVESWMILPGAEMNLSASYGDYLRIIGGFFAEQYAQQFGTSNYLDYSRFILSATRTSSTYTQLNTRVLKNLQTIIDKSKDGADPGMLLAATTLRAFTYQVLVDLYGEVPFTEALDESSSSPHYDDGQTVYTAILEEIDNALSGVVSTDAVGSNFLFEGSTDVENWIEFANALKLKILTRESGVNDVSAKIAALIAEDNFPSEDIAYDNIWADESGKASPLYQEETATYFGSTAVNLILNLALYGTMNAYDDARLKAAFDTNDSGNYTGGVSGSVFPPTTSYNAAYWCLPNFTYDMPVYLITVAETDFFIAEYYARQNNSAKAQEYYEAAIEASFNTLGVSGAEAAIEAWPYQQSAYAKCIGVQKWIHLGCTNNFEAWCELRRLDYPAFGSVSGDEIYDEANYTPGLYVAGTLYTPVQVSSSVGEGKILERAPYAESSSARNANVPDQPALTEPVFWGE